MNVGVIIAVLLILGGLGVAIYFLVNAKKCKDYDTQDDCKEPCQWDTEGNKCIEEDEDLTPSNDVGASEDVITPSDTYTPSSTAKRVDVATTSSVKVGMNVPIFCMKGGKPAGFLDYCRLHGNTACGGSGPAASKFFNGPVGRRMWFSGSTPGVSLGYEESVPGFDHEDDNATNIWFVYNDIKRQTGKKPAFMAVTSRYLEYPSGGRGYVWSYTFDENWRPTQDALEDMDAPWCNAGRDYLPIGTSGSDKYAFKPPKGGSTCVVYDVRGDNINKSANYHCEQPASTEPGGLRQTDFKKIKQNERKARQNCEELMGCGENEQCYAAFIGRGNISSYDCVKCELLDNSEIE
jgi:hypothetical protein